MELFSSKPVLWNITLFCRRRRVVPGHTEFPWGWESGEEPRGNGGKHGKHTWYQLRSQAEGAGSPRRSSWSAGRMKCSSKAQRCGAEKSLWIWQLALCCHAALPTTTIRVQWSLAQVGGDRGSGKIWMSPDGQLLASGWSEAWAGRRVFEMETVLTESSLASQLSTTSTSHPLALFQSVTLCTHKY
jgi:hypothetical protein